MNSQTQQYKKFWLQWNGFFKSTEENIHTVVYR